MREAKPLGSLILVLALLAALGWFARQNLSSPSKTIDIDENLREAREILRVWEAGVSPRTPPDSPPSRAKSSVQAVLDAGQAALDQTRALELMARIEKRKHYFAFGERFAMFIPIIDRSMTFWKQAEKRIPPSSKPKSTRPKLLVLTIRDRTPASADGSNVEAFIDPDMANALGDGLALDPTEVGGVVFLRWSQQRNGIYEPNSLTFGGSTVRSSNLNSSGALSAGGQVHLCNLYVVDAATGDLLQKDFLTHADPAQRSSGESSGLEALRREVAQRLNSLARESTAVGNESGSADP